MWFKYWNVKSCMWIPMTFSTWDYRCQYCNHMSDGSAQCVIRLEIVKLMYTVAMHNTWIQYMVNACCSVVWMTCSVGRYLNSNEQFHVLINESHQIHMKVCLVVSCFSLQWYQFTFVALGMGGVGNCKLVWSRHRQSRHSAYTTSSVALRKQVQCILCTYICMYVCTYVHRMSAEFY